jgi:hypothetical protein
VVVREVREDRAVEGGVVGAADAAADAVPEVAIVRKSARSSPRR